jgi:hypothetical protein
MKQTVHFHKISHKISKIFTIFFSLLVGNFTSSFIVNDEPKTHPYPTCIYGMKPRKKEENFTRGKGWASILIVHYSFLLVDFIEKAIELLKDTNVFPFFSFPLEQFHINQTNYTHTNTIR